MSQEELEYTRERHERRQRKIRRERSEQLATVREHLTDLRDNGVKPLLREKYEDTVPHRPSGNLVGDAQYFDDIRKKAHTLGGAVSLMIMTAHRELEELHELWHEYADYEGPIPQKNRAEELQDKANICKAAIEDAVAATKHEQKALQDELREEIVS